LTTNFLKKGLVDDFKLFISNKKLGINGNNNFKKNMAFGYVNSEQNLKGKDIEIEVEKTKYKAIIEAKPLHDPDNRIIKN